jgi:hypothetical protein
MAGSCSSVPDKPSTSALKVNSSVMQRKRWPSASRVHFFAIAYCSSDRLESVDRHAFLSPTQRRR